MGHSWSSQVCIGPSYLQNNNILLFIFIIFIPHLTHLNAVIPISCIYAYYFRDIPVGLLHLIPLGLAKHLLVQIVRQMDEKRIKEMGCHLQSLTPQLGTDFFKNIESRQGKDFKNYVSISFNSSLQVNLSRFMYSWLHRLFYLMYSCR